VVGRRGATRSVNLERHGAGARVRAKDAVVVEEPLEVRVSWVEPGGGRASEAIAVTMRTPGDDFELVAGFLHGEGLVAAPELLQELTYCRGRDPQSYNVVEARLHPGVPWDPGRFRRNFYASSSCGVCGKASLESVEAQGCRMLPDGFRVEGALLAELPERLALGQGAFRRTGGLHAAGIFDAAGSCEVCREDVGRHNAVDKAFGHRFLGRALPAADRILVVSGRASFEIVQKAVAAGVPAVVAVGAPSSLAVDLAERFNLTLVGFARRGTFNVYTGGARVS